MRTSLPLREDIRRCPLLALSGHCLVGCTCSSNSLRCRGRSNASLRSQSSALIVIAMTFGTKTCASVLCLTRHPHVGGTSCSKASPFPLGSPYRYSSSPLRPPPTPINGALPTELRAGRTVGSSLSNNAAQRSAEMAVSASQTSFTPGLKLHAPAANEGTIRANARRQDGWRFLKRRDVCFWHKADIGLCVAHVCF